VLQSQTLVNPTFDRLQADVHEIGRGIIKISAPAVDRDARFPSEAVAALKQLRLLSAYVPTELGGTGLTIAQIAKICEILGHYDGSVAMIFAMHQIQVACIVHHAANSEYFRAYLRELVDRQNLIASATSELGTGGDLRSSACSIDVDGDRFRLTKHAPVISYGADADDILLTCRRSADAQAGDQVQVLVHKSGFRLERASDWDTLGFRGTCSAGFSLTAEGGMAQVIPDPFSGILARTMHPCSHILWGSLWCGIAADAVNHARRFARAQARRNSGGPPVSSLRLAEVDTLLQSMRSSISAAVLEYSRILSGGVEGEHDDFRFAIRINSLKLVCSTLIVDIVGRAILVCGIEGYRNNSKFSLCRHLRDAYGAALMVNNDRIMNLNATMLLMQSES